MDDPQTLGSPAPPQVSPAGQAAPVPHVTVPPQPSAITPQFIGMPDDVTQTVLAVAGTQPAAPPHWFGVPPPPQVSVPVHVTQGAGMSPPQPSDCWPHSVATLGSAHVFGTQAAPPQTLGVPPPPHDWPTRAIAARRRRCRSHRRPARSSRPPERTSAGCTIGPTVEPSSVPSPSGSRLPMVPSSVERRVDGAFRRGEDRRTASATAR